MREDLLPESLDGKLIRLEEECAELIKAICKLRRFGFNPIDHKTGIKYDNMKDILSECEDVQHAINQLLNG